MKFKKEKFKFNWVVLIDDSELDNFITQKLLEAKNFAENISVFNSAVIALEQLGSIMEAQKITPDVLFVDINMPEMDGFEFLKSYVEMCARNGVVTGKLIILS